MKSKAAAKVPLKPRLPADPWSYVPSSMSTHSRTHYAQTLGMPGADTLNSRTSNTEASPNQIGGPDEVRRRDAPLRPEDRPRDHSNLTRNLPSSFRDGPIHIQDQGVSQFQSMPLYPKPAQQEFQ